MTYRSGAVEPSADQRVRQPSTTTAAISSPPPPSTTPSYVPWTGLVSANGEAPEDVVVIDLRKQEKTLSQSKKDRPGESDFRRAPSRISEDQLRLHHANITTNAITSSGFESADDALRLQIPSTAAPPTPRPTTPRPSSPRVHSTTVSTTSAKGSALFYVIKDPREQRRQRLIELRRRIFPEEFITTTTSIPTTPMDHFDEKFTLPRIADKLSTFSLTNGAKITSYTWIGIYDQCQRKHMPLVVLRDIDPPKEERILPLSGWSHNVTSFRLHILNCNTILVPGFSYDPTDATRNTYFFVGIGRFPDRIERQLKVTVVGSRHDEPLKAYKSEDVLLRLPRGYRTFDVDYISVYNTDEEKSYGHVTIPSLLVPPCTEE